MNQIKHIPYIIGTYLLLIHISLETFSQMNSSIEIKIVNDILIELIPADYKCLYIYNKNSVSPIYNKTQYEIYLNKLETIVGSKIAQE